MNINTKHKNEKSKEKKHLKRKREMIEKYVK